MRHHEEESPTSPQWHPSYEPAVLPAPSVHTPTEAGRRALAALRAQVHANRGEEPARRRVQLERKAWQELPELYRRMVAAAAGLPRELVDTKDRDLSERDKVMMRSAIGDMRAWLDSVAAL